MRLVALTKVDRVDTEPLELAVEDVKTLLAGSFLQDAPIMPVSAMTGTGIRELSLELQKIAAKLEPRPPGRSAFPADRQGFPYSGVRDGRYRDCVRGSREGLGRGEIIPSGALARVRSLEVHDKPVQEASAGQGLP